MTSYSIQIACIFVVVFSILTVILNGDLLFLSNHKTKNNDRKQKKKHKNSQNTHDDHDDDALVLVHLKQSHCQNNRIQIYVIAVVVAVVYSLLLFISFSQQQNAQNSISHLHSWNKIARTTATRETAKNPRQSIFCCGCCCCLGLFTACCT